MDVLSVSSAPYRTALKVLENGEYGYIKIGNYDFYIACVDTMVIVSLICPKEWWLYAIMYSLPDTECCDRVVGGSNTANRRESGLISGAHILDGTRQLLTTSN